MVTFWVTQKSEEEEFDVLLDKKLNPLVKSLVIIITCTCKTKFRGILRKLKLILEEIINDQVENT